MILKLQPTHNKKMYVNNLKLDSNILVIESKEEWNNFLFQNKQRKNNKNNNDNDNFMFKRIKKNITGINDLISKIGFNNKIDDGYFLDYSSYVNIFLYFKSESEIIDYVQDTCLAWGQKSNITSFNDALSFLTKENVVISNVHCIYFNKNEWEQYCLDIQENINNKKEHTL